MKYLKPLLVFIFGFIILLFSESFQQQALINCIAQLVLFGLVVCWPIWKTGRLCYVDIGWPWGLVCIGIVTLIFGEGYALRVNVVGAIYIFIGARMGLGALHLWRKGYMQKEFPRYQYQRGRFGPLQSATIAPHLESAKFFTSIDAYDPQASIGLRSTTVAIQRETIGNFTSFCRQLFD